MESIKARFFGRKTLIADIVQGVLAPGQPLDFSLVGPKMIGKTRLLHYLAAPNGPLCGPDPQQRRTERFQEGHNIIVGLYNCDWPDAKINLPQFINQRLHLQLESQQNLGLNWSQIERVGSPGQQIVQMARLLDQQQIRLVLMLDNFDQVLLSNKISSDMVNELRPLTSELGLVVATEQPLYDLNQTLAASPLFNLMHQHFLGLLEPDAAQEWIEAYHQRTSWTPSVGQALLEMAGRHPFLLASIGDVLIEIKSLLAEDAPIDVEHLSLVKLRLAEHGRPLFDLLWRKLNETKFKSILPLVERLITRPIALDQILTDQTAGLNWLINHAVVACNGTVYYLFSPLFQEYLTNQMEVEYQSSAVWPVTAATVSTGPDTLNIFDKLSPKEADLLRYFQANSDKVISVDELLAQVWNQPAASPRRVQEAIRRLRNSLQKYSPRIGVIENERGVGYRYIPAHTRFE